jgi:O-antigen/teichoic acid export membrane protein
MIRSLPLTAFGPLIAASARESATDDAGRTRAFYERSYRAVLALGVAPLAALYGASYVLIIAWVGGAYHTSGLIAVVLGIGYTINVATGAGTTLAMGAGRPDIDRNYSVLGFALNAVLTVGLGILIGKWGVIVATTLGLVLSSLWLLRLVDRWLGSNVLSLRHIAGTRGTLALILLGATIGGAATAAGIAGDVSNRWVALAIGVGAMSLFAVIWLVAVDRLGVLDVRRVLGRRTPARDRTQHQSVVNPVPHAASEAERL